MRIYVLRKTTRIHVGKPSRSYFAFFPNFSSNHIDEGFTIARKIAPFDATSCRIIFAKCKSSEIGQIFKTSNTLEFDGFSKKFGRFLVFIHDLEPFSFQKSSLFLKLCP